MTDKPKRNERDYVKAEGTTFNPPTRDKLKAKQKSKVIVSKTTGEITFIGKPPPEDWIPEGWVLIGGNRWVPSWPACKYRRLSVLTPKNNAPEIRVKCTEKSVVGDAKDGLKIITPQECMGCKVFEAQQKSPPITRKDEELMRSLFARDFPDLVKEFDPDKPGRQIVSAHPFAGYNERELDEVEEAIYIQAFVSDLPEEEMNKYHPRNRRASHLKFGIPCLDRIKVLKNPDNPEDCQGCGEYKLICNNPDAEWYEKKVTRKKCAGCPCPTPLQKRFPDKPGPGPDDLT